MDVVERFAQWMSQHEHIDKKWGYVYNYHPRSDAHSVKLCEFILDDLLSTCSILEQQAQVGRIAYGINLEHTWPKSNKKKRLDLAIGIPYDTTLVNDPPNTKDGKVKRSLLFV